MYPFTQVSGSSGKDSNPSSAAVNLKDGRRQGLSRIGRMERLHTLRKHPSDEQVSGWGINIFSSVSDAKNAPSWAPTTGRQVSFVIYT